MQTLSVFSSNRWHVLFLNTKTFLDVTLDSLGGNWRSGSLFVVPKDFVQILYRSILMYVITFKQDSLKLWTQIDNDWVVYLVSVWWRDVWEHAAPGDSLLTCVRGAKRKLKKKQSTFKETKVSEK